MITRNNHAEVKVRGGLVWHHIDARTISLCLDNELASSIQHVDRVLVGIKPECFWWRGIERLEYVLVHLFLYSASVEEGMHVLVLEINAEQVAACILTAPVGTTTASPDDFSWAAWSVNASRVLFSIALTCLMSLKCNMDASCARQKLGAPAKVGVVLRSTTKVQVY